MSTGRWMWSTVLTALCAVPAAAAAAEVPPRTIEVEGHGRVSVPPDRAVAVFAVETEAEDAAGAASTNAELAARVVAAMKGRLGEGDRVSTLGYALSPRYEPAPGRQGTSRLVGYRASNRVRVETGDLTGVGALIDAGVAAGANRVDSIDFHLEEREPAVRSALAEAGADAESKAKAIAAALGVSLGPVLRATTSPGRGGPVPVPRMAAMATSRPETPVEPGEIEVDATLSVVYAIE